MKSFFAGLLLLASAAGSAHAGTFREVVESMATSRGGHTATLLSNGRVLVAGGGSSSASAELFDRSSGFSSTGSLAVGRFSHTATALADGRVLIAGGVATGGTVTNSAEIYDAATGNFSGTNPLNVARRRHTATLLADGRVLLAGGSLQSGVTASAEIYDPSTGNFTTTGSMSGPRSLHCATLLPDGKVLITGGITATLTLSSAEVYDPATGTFSAVGAMGITRARHTATLLSSGLVLVTGGLTGGGGTNTADLFDPASGTFTATDRMNAPRAEHTASLLPDGKVLIVGFNVAGAAQVSTDLYDPATATFLPGGFSAVARAEHTATLLPGGDVFIAGNGEGQTDRNRAELYRHDAPWSMSASMAVARTAHTATLLPDGKVLIAGGSDGSSSLSSAQRFDAASETFLSSGPMATARDGHSATLLTNGRVLVTGGGTTTSELYDPSTQSFSPTGSLTGPSLRRHHAATLLADGRVLVTGGSYSFGPMNRAEIYDPVAGTFQQIASMAEARSKHAAVLLGDGRVLIVGGGTSASATCEIFDPGTETFELAEPMSNARRAPEATLLPDGSVFVTGGMSGAGTDEIYRPATDTWVALSTSVNPGRTGHEATLLSDGQVLITGGDTTPGSTGVFDQATLFVALSDMPSPRADHRATLLPTGKVLITGGLASGTATNTAMLLDAGKGLIESRRPLLDAVPVVCQPASINATGLRFTSNAGGSDGSTNDSSTNLPLLRLQRVEGEHVAFAEALTRTATAFASKPVSGLPPGRYRASVISVGIPSVERVVEVSTSAAPVLALYSNRTTQRGQSITNVPYAAHDYQGTFTSLAVSASAGFTGGLSVDPATGTVSVTDAAPVGTFTISVIATTTCASSQRNFTLSVKALLPPAGFSATASSTSSVALQWSAVTGASQYQVLRSTNGTNWTPVATVSGTTHEDTGLTPNTAYLYRVRGVDAIGGAGPESATDLAITILFASTPAGTIIQRTHVEQLRAGVNALRAAAGSGPFAFTDPNLTGQVVKAVHMQQIWSAHDAARVQLGFASRGTIAVAPGDTIYGDALVTIRMGMQ